MPLTRETKSAIHAYLLGELTRYVKTSLKDSGEKPFHVRLLPALGDTKFSERSFSTRTGSWFQRTALLVAKQFHPEAKLSYLVVGRIKPAAEAHITEIVETLDHGKPKRKPDRKRDIAEVLAVQSVGGAQREVRTDLYVRRRDKVEMFFELKTPGPNKGQCKRMKQDILTISALTKEGKGEAYAACAYNPFGDGKPYTHTYALQFLQIGADFLIGREFWSKVGDTKTYDELLAIAEEVGEEVRPLWSSE